MQDPDRAANPLSSGKTVPTKAPNGGQLRRRGPHLRLQVGATGAAIVIWAVSTGCCSVARVARVARVAPLGSEISRLQPRRGQQRPLARIASSVGCSAATPPKSRAILEPSQLRKASFVHRGALVPPSVPPCDWPSARRVSWHRFVVTFSARRLVHPVVRVESSTSGARRPAKIRPLGPLAPGQRKRWSRGSWPAGDSKVLSSTTRRAFSCFWDLEAENG
jgi:hypothetical protein